MNTALGLEELSNVGFCIKVQNYNSNPGGTVRMMLGYRCLLGCQDLGAVGRGIKAKCLHGQQASYKIRCL